MSDDRPKRAWLVLSDGSGIEEVPGHLVEDEGMFWPPQLHAQGPEASVQYHGQNTLYVRHRLEDGIYLFLRSDQDPEGVSEAVLNDIRDLAGQ